MSGAAAHRGGRTYLVVVGADLDGVGDEFGRLLLGHGRDVLQQDGDLDTESGMRTSLHVVGAARGHSGTYGGLPAEDVAVETQPVL